MLKSIHTAIGFEFEIEDAVRRYADMVYRLAVLNTGNRYEADDVFQNVFLKLFQHKQSITSEEHLKAWLIRVTINQSRSVTGSIWNKRKVSLDAVENLAQDTASEDYSPVYDAVRSLPKKYQQVIHMFYYEDLQISEIAQLLDRNESTIKTQLARGRKLLKEKLGGSFHDE